MMNKNKKIIALICVISMIFSVFAAFTITASAEDKGIVFEYDKDSSTTTKMVVNVKSAGFTDGVEAFTAKVNLPSNVALKDGVADVSVEFNVKGFTDSNVEADNTIYGITFAASEAIKPENDVLAVITINLASELSSNFTMSLQKGSSISKGDDKLIYNDNNNTLSVSTLRIPKDPDAEIEEPLPKPSVNPDVQLPTTKPTIDVQKGIIFEYDEDASDDTKVVLNVKSVGFTDGVEAFTAKVNLPSNVALKDGVADVSVEFNVKGFTDSNVEADNTIYGITFAASEAIKPENDVLAVITINLQSALTTDYFAELQKGSSISKGDDKLIYNDNNETLKAAWTRVPAAGAVEYDNQIPLITQGSTKGLIDEPSGELSDQAYAALEVTKKNGDPAVYDEDYTAYYNGVKLTKQQLDNLLAGQYCESEGKTLLEMLKGVVLHYNNGINAKLQIVDNGEVISSGESGSSSSDKDKTQAGSITPAKTTKTVYVGDSVSLKLTTKAAKDKTGSNMAYNEKVESVTINVDAASYNVLSATGITIETVGLKSGATEDTKANRETKKTRVNINNADEEVVLPHSLDNTYTIKFTPLAKTPKDEPIDFTVTYTDANKKTSEAVATYKVNEKSSGSSSSSSSSGSGSKNDKNSSDVLANGNNGLLSGLLGGVSPFTDMANYSWAQEAVNALAAKNIISGRGDGTFDPGGQVTRAEYAQMLINAIGKSGDYADTTFLDVPTDAWFYHNVAVAAQLDIVRGYGDGNFGPYDLITREQMALMTQKAAIVMNKSLSGAAVGAFSDDADIADWAKAAVYDLANVGIINGMGDGTFAPKANATRAQAAVIIYSAFIK